MSSITIDGLDEEIFRRNIEGMLRVGEADRAAAKLRALIEPFCGEDRILPSRFAQVTAADVVLEGWDNLAHSLARNDRPRNPISALTIAISNAEVLGFDGDDARPVIATSHYTDEAYPFSNSGLGDLLDGYSFYGCEWHGSSAHVDTALTLGGVDDLYRAVAAVEAELIASVRPDPDKIRAGSIGSCYLAVLVYQAVRDAVRTAGVPRAICVMAGNEGIYPYFDAPVIGSMECVEQGLVAGTEQIAAVAADVPEAAPAAVQAQADAEPEMALAEPVGTFGSLAGIVGRKSEKKPVLQLAEADLQSAAEMFDQASQDWMRGTTSAAPCVPPSGHDEQNCHEWPPEPAPELERDVFADPASFRELGGPWHDESAVNEVRFAQDPCVLDDGQIEVTLTCDPVEDLAAAASFDDEVTRPGICGPVEFEPQPELASPATHSLRSRIAPIVAAEPEPVKVNFWTALLRRMFRRPR